ncbi:hypothetical protein HYQ45_000805 [Verticillium longisporum]|uniref:Uncharacterized protein n=1 Tax=Verticillium longisporum TaxID=100787 RepID=A0A8I3A3N5_VERLO|nr:hypothetical protein HYQ45_000805 [Verticillium longisporum]
MTTMSNKTKGKLPEVIDLTQQSAFRPYSGAKKIVIKNLRPPTQTDKTEQYYDRTRQQLKDALPTSLSNCQWRGCTGAQRISAGMGRDRNYIARYKSYAKLT